MKYKANCKVGDKVMVEATIKNIRTEGEPQICYSVYGWNFEMSRELALEKGLIKEVHEVKVGQVYADEDDVDADNAWEVIYIRGGVAVMVCSSSSSTSLDTWTGTLANNYFCKENLVKDVD